MKPNQTHRKSLSLKPVSIAAALCLAISLPTASLGQRGPGDRGGKKDNDSRGSDSRGAARESYERRQSNPPARSEPAQQPREIRRDPAPQPRIEQRNTGGQDRTERREPNRTDWGSARGSNPAERVDRNANSGAGAPQRPSSSPERYGFSQRQSWDDARGRTDTRQPDSNRTDRVENRQPDRPYRDASGAYHNVPRRDTQTPDRNDRRDNPSTNRDNTPSTPTPRRDNDGFNRSDRFGNNDNRPDRRDDNRGDFNNRPRRDNDGIDRGNRGDQNGRDRVNPGNNFRDRNPVGVDRVYNGRDRNNNRGNDFRYGRIDRDNFNPRPQRNPAYAAFTRSQEGRRFNNGINLRRPTYYNNTRDWDRYFPNRYSYFPHYVRPGISFNIGFVWSPYRYYYGVCPPYIEREYVIVSRPRTVYVETPVYVDRVYSGYSNTGSDYYLREQADDTRWKSDKELSQAVFDLEDGFRDNDITLLAGLTDPSAQISVFSKGQYDYSLEPNDYLDMTRDFMREAETVDFSVYRVRQKTNNVYQAFARHTYKDRNGEEHTVFLCVALERINGRWTMIQVDTSPESLED